MITGMFAHFVARSRPSDLSPDAQAATKRGMLDCLGATLAGSVEEVARIVTKRAAQDGARGASTVIRGGLKTSAQTAAWVNGALGHALDYDDVIHVGKAWIGHPSVVVLPAVLAVAEETGASGAEVLHAYALGVELYAHIGMFCGLRPYAMGWHNTCYLGTLAAAGAAAKLLGLDALGVRRALGIAGSLAGGLRQNFGTMTKPLHAGISARNGVEAAKLAQAGLTADENILEAPMGVRSVFNFEKTDLSKGVPYGEETITADEFAARLGSPWMIQTPGLAFKLCPSCRGTHFSMDAGLMFRKAYPDQVGRIVEVDCHMPAPIAAMVFYHEPKTGLEGKFSMEYVLSRAILDGLPKMSDFTEARVCEAEVRALIKKLNWNTYEPPAGSLGVARFVFQLDDGTEFVAAVEHPMGEPENPVSDEMLIAKFDDCASTVLDDGARDKLRALILGMESQPDVRELMAVLGAKG